MTKPAFTKPPAHIAKYVEVLGEEEAVRFLLRFGGSELYRPQSPKYRSALVKEFGQDVAKRLGQETGHLSPRVPLAKNWLARVLHTKGLPVAEIARTLHVTDVTVRGYLNTARVRPPPDPRQDTLF